MNKKPIAFFDSGVGGITVFKRVKQLLPYENYIYFGDLKNLPYGEKTPEELYKFVDNILKFFEKQDAKAVVMACNTTAATVYEKLKDNYGFKIYPIIQASVKAISQIQAKRIGVFATNATIKSGIYAKELKKYNPNLEVFETATPEWVKIVENQTQSLQENIELIEKYIKEMLKNKPDKIILGCTHYPYLMDVLSQFAPTEMFIDPSVYFADFIKSRIEEIGLNSNENELIEQFFVSANPEQFKNAASIFYPLKDLPKLIV